jgi:hypothetical protein
VQHAGETNQKRKKNNRNTRDAATKRVPTHVTSVILSPILCLKVTGVNSRYETYREFVAPRTKGLGVSGSKQFKNDGRILLPSGEGGATAPDEGSLPHDFVDLQNRGAGCPHPALARHPLPVGEGITKN